MDAQLEDARLATADKKPVKNEDLWRASTRRATGHEVDWHWVTGHADDPLNNRVDELAVAAMAPFRKRRGGTKPG